MNNPIKEYKRMFRVIGGERTELIGKELELYVDYAQDFLVGLWVSARRGRITNTFKKSDVQELTPVSFNNRRIAIGDEVMFNNEWLLVHGYHYAYGTWFADVVKDNDWQNKCFEVDEYVIEKHRTPQDNKIDISDDEFLKEFCKRKLCKRICDCTIGQAIDDLPQISRL